MQLRGLAALEETQIQRDKCHIAKPKNQHFATANNRE